MAPARGHGARPDAGAASWIAARAQTSRPAARTCPTLHRRGARSRSRARTSAAASRVRLQARATGGDPTTTWCDGPHGHDREDPARRGRPALLRGHHRRRPRPGAAARHRPLPVLLRGGGGAGVIRADVTAHPQILVAGHRQRVAAATTASAAEVAKRLEQRELPEGVAVFDFGSGGLDLAYEVMRGYDALVLVDVSRQGGEPGTLYVMEPDQEESTAGIEDGEMIDPHGMDPQTVLRFVKAVGGWPGKVVVVACEPADGRGDGHGPQRRGGRRRGPRGRAWCSSRSRSCGARALPEQRDPRHRAAPRRRAPGERAWTSPSARCARWCRLAGVLLGDRAARHGLRGRAARAGRWSRRACAATTATTEWTLDEPVFRCPSLRGSRRGGAHRHRVLGGVDRRGGGGAQCTAPG